MPVASKSASPVSPKTVLMPAPVVIRSSPAPPKATFTPVPPAVITSCAPSVGSVLSAWIGMPLEAAGLIGLPVRSGSITTLSQAAPFHNRSIVALNDTSHLA